MRIAAGVLLIIAAIFNLFASFGYLAGGTVASAGSEYTAELQQKLEAEIKNGDTNMTEEDKRELDKAREVMGSGGVTWQAMGVFLLISVGMLIAGAVFLFINQKPTFILISGAIAILAEVLGIIMVAFGVMNIVGLIGGVLAIVCANAMRKALNPV